MTQPAPTPAASPETILTVTHWTIRTRILASFTIILLVMALMSGVAYRRLSAIEHETTVMRTDALPGLNFSAGMRGVWGEIYVLAWQTVTAADAPSAPACWRRRRTPCSVSTVGAAVRRHHRS
jgi:methyl-accepting chemotaxis protein WspA